MERDIIKSLAKVRDYCTSKENCVNCEFKAYEHCILHGSPSGWLLDWQLLHSKEVTNK